MTDTVLPYNGEAEEHVAAACLTSGAACERVAEILRPDHLFLDRYATIVRHCLAAHDRGDPVDQVILAERIGDPDIVQTVRDLTAAGYPASNVAHHARIVREHATRRDLIQVGQNIARSGWEPPEQGVDHALGLAESAVYDLTAQHEPGELRHISHTLDHTIEMLDRPGGEITGTPIGLVDLDRVTAGLQPGNLVVIAARPGQGKSALALQAALHCAVTRDKAAAVFTLEMSADELNQRSLAQLARVPLMRIRTRNGLTMEDRAAITRARGILDNAPLYIDDTVAARTVDIRARSRRLKQRQPDLALIVVDYLQLMIHEGNGRENREQQVAAISRGLKLLARELDVPVIALAQLNREVERRGTHAKPMLADLRDSGAIEQDSDVVIFIHRDPEPDQEGVAHLLVAKHRNGPTGDVKAAWLKRLAHFADLAEDN